MGIVIKQLTINLIVLQYPNPLAVPIGQIPIGIAHNQIPCLNLKSQILSMIQIRTLFAAAVLLTASASFVSAQTDASKPKTATDSKVAANDIEPIDPLDVREQKLPRLSKAERREWKGRLGELEPEEFKAMIEKHEATASKVSDKDKEIAALRKQLSDNQELLAQTKSQLEASAKAPVVAVEEASKQSYTARAAEVTKGVIFKVQIGSYRNKDLAKYFDKNPNFSGDVDSDGIKRYTLGSFTDYWEADNFKKYLREMGVAEAWTVPYRDGKRVRLRDVLEGAAAQAAGIGMN
jgi:hypothetical protein